MWIEMRGMMATCKIQWGDLRWNRLLSHPHKRFPYLKGKGYICYKKKRHGGSCKGVLGGGG